MIARPEACRLHHTGRTIEAASEDFSQAEQIPRPGRGSSRDEREAEFVRPRALCAGCRQRRPGMTLPRSQVVTRKIADRTEKRNRNGRTCIVRHDLILHQPIGDHDRAVSTRRRHPRLTAWGRLRPASPSEGRRPAVWSQAARRCRTPCRLDDCSPSRRLSGTALADDGLGCDCRSARHSRRLLLQPAGGFRARQAPGRRRSDAKHGPRMPRPAQGASVRLRAPQPVDPF